MSKAKRDSKTMKRAEKSCKKTVYRVSNWAEYYVSLVQRASLTVWIDEEVLGSWHPVLEGRRKRGGLRQVKRIAIPPRRNARIWQPGNSSRPPLPRDQNLRRLRRVGRTYWKHEVGYHRRSLAETAVFRFKLTIGNPLSARSLPHQITEARI